jgi:hypothetical protein
MVGWFKPEAFWVSGRSPHTTGWTRKRGLAVGKPFGARVSISPSIVGSVRETAYTQPGAVD